MNDVVAVSGFAAAGSHVDVLIAGNPPGGNQAAGTVTKTLLQNVEILSAGATIQKDAEGKPVSVPTVNLLLTPAQAEIMSLASNEARIQIGAAQSYRQGRDETPGNSHGVFVQRWSGAAAGGCASGNRGAPGAETRAAATSAAPAKVVVPPPPPPINVEVIHGSRKVEQKFDVRRKR